MTAKQSCRGSYHQTSGITKVMKLIEQSDFTRLINFISQLAWIRHIDNIDRSIYQRMRPCYSNRPALTIMNIVSMSCSWLFCFPLYFLLLFLQVSNGSGQNGSLIFYHFIAAEFIQLTIIISLRYFTKRERPAPAFTLIFNENAKLYALVVGWNRYSFPSLHASRAFMICIITYNGLDIHNMDFICLFLLFVSAMTVMLGRLILQRHFMSDVVTGATVGMISAFATLNIFF